jgi:tonB-linked outer membrane protein, susC/ragA family
MKKRLTMLLASLFLFVGAALAQVQVSGVVTSSEDGEPIIGASVKVVGTKTGTVTDPTGSFKLEVPNTNARLEVSYVGMMTKTVKAERQLKVTLDPDNRNLDEVVVVAYGTAKKSAYTGAASEIKADKIVNRQTSNITSALVGSMAGVQVIQDNGQPGQEMTIRVRGVSSINGSMKPLYVVDGVPFDGELSSINPSDIEKITTLKDAVSTSLYGSRGANGVVMITTKRGQLGRAKINVDAKWGATSRELPNYDVIKDPKTYYELLYKGYYNTYLGSGRTAAQAHSLANNRILQRATGYRIWTLPRGESLVNEDGTLNSKATLGYSDGKNFFTVDDWEKESFKTTLRQEYNVNVSGASDAFNYYTSFGYLNDQGIIKGSGFERLSARSNLEYKARPWLTIGSNIAFIHINSAKPGNQDSNNTSSSANVFNIAYTMAPVYPMYVRGTDGNILYNTTTGKKIYDYGDGSSTAFTRNHMSIANPIGSLVYDKREFLHDIFEGNWFARFDLTHGFTATARLGVNTDNMVYHLSRNPLYGQSAANGGDNSGELDRESAFTHQYLLNYANSFGKHNVSAVAGFEGYLYKFEAISAQGQNLYKLNDYTVGNTIDQRSGDGQIHEYRTAGIFFSGNYNFEERFFLSLGYRRDGTSAFSKDNRWGNFANIGLGWNLKKESWLSNVDALDLLKVRASFGQTGNDNHLQSLSDVDQDFANYTFYAYEDQYKVTGSNGVFSDAMLRYKGNPNLKWEKTNAFDFGADYSLWKGRLSGSLDFYYRATSNLLDFKKVALSNGYSAYPVNMGTVQNYGIELEANYEIIKRKDVNWNVSLNATWMGNRIQSLSADYDNGRYITANRMYREGGAIYNFYLVEYAGVDAATGKALYKGAKTTTDANGNEVAQTDANGNIIEELTDNWQNAFKYNRKETGNILPKVYGGFSSTVNWKGIDLSLQTSYQLGGKLLDTGYEFFMSSGSDFKGGQGVHKDLLKSWTSANPSTDVPRFNLTDDYASARSSRFLITSNFFSIDNITLGYTLPRQWLSSAGIEQLRVYFAADNLYVFSGRKGMDPRQTFTGANNRQYSARRTLSLGVKLGF